MSIVISTTRRKVLSLLLRAVAMRFFDHSTITYRNYEVSNFEFEHHSLLTILPHVWIHFHFFLLLHRWLYLFHFQNNSRFSPWTLFQRIYPMTNRAGHFGPQTKRAVNKCVHVSKASHDCNAVLILLPNMVEVILTWLFVFQAIDFKTAKYVTGLECCSRVGTREDGAFLISHW